MTPGQVVRMLLDIILTLVPHEEARLLLDEAAIARANAVADAAEKAKFG
jgi:hypothetical protein